MIHSARFATSESYQTHKLCTYANILIFKTPQHWNVPRIIKCHENGHLSWKATTTDKEKHSDLWILRLFWGKGFLCEPPRASAMNIFAERDLFLIPGDLLRGKKRINFWFKTFFFFYFMFQIFLSAFSHSFINKKNREINHNNSIQLFFIEFNFPIFNF